MVTAITAVIAAIISFSLGALIGVVTMGLMTNNKINSIYDEAGRLQDFKKDESKE